MNVKKTKKPQKAKNKKEKGKKSHQENVTYVNMFGTMVKIGPGTVPSTKGAPISKILSTQRRIAASGIFDIDEDDI